MFIETIVPRFSETDALGHINNTVVPTWLEQARTPVFRWFVPDLDPRNWCLIIAKIEVEFRREIVYGQAVRVETYVEEVGNSSFRVGQKIYQGDQLCVQGSSVLVHFDYGTKKSKPIPAPIRQQMEAHLQP